jgi:hypothetical protein
MERQGTIGLRHIVEGGIRILEGASLEESRRRYILKELEQFLDEAGKASSLVHEHAWVAAPSEKGAIESYLLVDAYMPDAGSLEADLTRASACIQEFKNNESVAPDKVMQTKNFLKDLLHSMKASRLRLA